MNEKEIKITNGIQINSVIVCNSSYTNDDKITIYKGQLFKCLDIIIEKRKYYCMININNKNTLFPIKYNGLNILQMGNAETNIRFQGQEFTEPYTIHNGDEMTLEEISTAITRATHHNQIRFSNINKLINKSFKSTFTNQKMKLIKGNKDKNKYHYLYKIQCDLTNTIYVGRTSREDLSLRFEEHTNNIECVVYDIMKNPQNTYFYNNNKEQSRMFGFNNIQEVNKMEQSHIRDTIRKYGNKCINKKVDGYNPNQISQKQTELNNINTQQSKNIINLRKSINDIKLKKLKKEYDYSMKINNGKAMKISKTKGLREIQYYMECSEAQALIYWNTLLS
jgi:hypothetical protein